MIQALSTDRTNHPLSVRILARRAGRNQHLLDTHPCNTASKGFSVNAVSISKNMAGSADERKGFNHLLRCPRRRRMRCHIHMKNASTIVPENKEHIQNPKRRCRHREEVDRNDVQSVIVQETPPALRRRLGSTHQVPGHCCLRNLKTKFEQLTMNARSTPTNIGSLHLSNEFSKLSVDTRTTNVTAFPRPISPKTRPMPSNDRVGMQCYQHLPPTFEIAREGYPKEAISKRGTSALRASPQHRELLTKNQVLQDEFMPPSEARPQPAKKQSHPHHHDNDASARHEKRQAFQYDRFYRMHRTKSADSK